MNNNEIHYDNAAAKLVLLDAVSFYDKMPEIGKPLTIIHNQTKEVHEAIRTEHGLFVNGNRVSGCYYSWVYSNCTYK